MVSIFDWRRRNIAGAFAFSIAGVAVSLSGAQPRFDLIIRAGDVIDGTGSPARRADVGVRGDSIAEIGDLSAATAARTIAATGLVVAPGFIDMHSHSDYTLLVDGRALSKVMQGVTTELLGEADRRGPCWARRGKSGRNRSPTSS